jgi:aminoglycoside phosphotransferase (APT) family kinase protein
MAEVRGDPATIDAAWMTDALEDAGVAMGATVTSVTLDRFVGTGQMSRNARLSLTWDRPEGRPRTVVGKFPSDDANARMSSFATGIYQKEVGFYQHIAGTVAIRTPQCWVARFDAEPPDFVLIMEDLDGSEQGDQFAGCSDAEAELAIEAAVGLHAPRWGDPTLARLAALHPADGGDAADGAAKTGGFYRACLAGCLQRLGPRLDDDVVALVEDFGALIERWSRSTGTARTIVHGDFRPDNFLFGRTPHAPPLAVVDWQTVSEGLGTADIAYLIAGSYPPEKRSVIEPYLVEEYRRRLEAAGVNYRKDDCWRDYRWSTLHGVVIGVTATMFAKQTQRGDDLFTLMVSRHARQAIELEALDLIR